MATYVKKKEKQQPKGVIQIPPWDPKKKTPWKKIPTWEKDKRPKPTPLSNKEIKDLGKKAKEAFKLLKKHYPKIGTDY